MRRTSSACASNPRDKIYDLLGLATARDQTEFNIRYGDEIPQVFADFTKHIIQTKATFDIFVDQWSPATGQEQVAILSWVQDFSRPPRTTPLSMTKVHSFSASSETLPNDPGHEPSTLTVRLIRLDTVEHILRDCVAEIENGDHIDSFRLLSLPIMQTFLANTANHPMSDIDPRKKLKRTGELWRTLILDQGSSSVLLASEIYREIFEAIGTSIDGNGIQDIAELGHSLGSKFNADEEYVRLVVRTFEHRILFTTRDGFIGVAPESVQKGDHVVIAHGASTPVVLRASTTPGTFSLVGDCYFKGAMYGEAMRCGLEEEVVTLV